jgi:predicted HAD superfamily Cof-like phosphohydrolase
MQAQANTQIANLHQIVEVLNNRITKLEHQYAELQSVCHQLVNMLFFLQGK